MRLRTIALACGHRPPRALHVQPRTDHPRIEEIPRRVRQMLDISDVLTQCSTITSAHAATLCTRVRLAHQALLTGQGTPADFDEVTHFLNIALYRCLDIDRNTERHNPDCPTRLVPYITAAHAPLRRCRTRIESIGRSGFDGPGMHAVHDALDVAEQVISASSRAQLAAAIETAHEILTQRKEQPA